MKFRFDQWMVALLGLALVATCSAQPPAKSDGKPELPRVIASATATALVKPDAARITFSISAHEPIEKSPREANEKQVKKLRDAIAALPLGKVDMDIQVSPAAVGLMVTGAQNTGGPTVHSRKAESVFQINIRERDFDKLRDAVARIIESACENGGTSNNDPDSRQTYRIPRIVAGNNDEETEAVPGPSVEWLSSATSGPRRDAIRRAMKEAIADAEAAVGSAKVNVVEVMVTNTETSTDRTSRYSSSEFAPPHAGMVRVSVEVRVTCTY